LSTTTPAPTPDDAAAVPAPQGPPPAPPRRSRLRRTLRALAWSFGGLIVLVLAIAAGAWWWLGSDQSLAAALARAARYLPAGHTLEARDVTGSVRAGGHIGWLRWQGPTLAVEVNQAEVGWQIRPLFSRQLKLGEVRAAQITIERRGPVDDKPPEPLEQLALPIDIDLPFKIDRVRWVGPPALEARALSGHYRYTDAHHTLALDGVDIADGHYSGKLRLQGPAPMALDLSLDGKVRAPLAEGRSMEVAATAAIQGTLATAAARLQVEAHLAPVELPANPDQGMSADVKAQIAPWQAQPVIDAAVDLRHVDAAMLWPGAPVTYLSGTVDAGPDGGAAPPTPSAPGGTSWKVAIDLTNGVPGPWDEDRVPVERVEASAVFDGVNWAIPSATVRSAGGTIEAEGEWSPMPAPWQIQARVSNVKPGELHTQLAGAPVDGRITARQRDDRIAFDVDLKARGAAGAAALQGLRLQQIGARGDWKAQVLDLGALRIEAEGAKVEGKLQLRVAEQAGSGELALTLPGGDARIKGAIAPARGAGEVKAKVTDAAALQAWIEKLPGLATVFKGASAQGAAQLDARWDGGWQAVQQRLRAFDQPVARAAEPTVQATLLVPKLDLRLPPGAAAQPAPAPIQLRGLQAELAGSLAQATLRVQGQALSGTRQITLDTRAGGGLERPGQWRVAIDTLRLQAQDSTRPGPWTVETAGAVNATVRAAAARLDIEATAGAATLRGPVPGTVRIEWQPLRFNARGEGDSRAIQLQSRGKLEGLPMAWAQAFGGNEALGEYGLSGDLVFDGDWDIDAGATLKAKARLARRSGDLRLQAGEAAMVTRIESRGTGTASERTLRTASGDSANANAGTPAGLRQAELRIDAEGDRVRTTLAWDSERAGELRANAETQLVQRQEGWQWLPDAPLAGRITARLPQLGVWSMLAPPGWRIAGTLDADATLSGNRSAPRWNGTLAADKLSLRASVEGLDLRDGRLRATLAGDRIAITDFTLQGGAGSSVRIGGQAGNRSTARSEALGDGGTLAASGEVRWGAAPGDDAAGLRLAATAQLKSLRLLVRSDRQLAVSGELQARMENSQISLRGALKSERAVIILPDETAPSLGSDVVVRSAAKDAEARKEAERQGAREQAQAARAQTAKPPDVAVSFDLGDDFAVQGRGITTRLEGKLDIRSTGGLGAPPRITGEVRTVKGQYRSYGQELDIESGVVRFNGPFDNPALDVLAIRPNITQRAGVQITGTALSPRVRLYSEPALSDAETLSWVMLGRSSASSGAESIVLQQAALALLSGLGRGGASGGLASRFGLDEIGFKGPGSSGDVRSAAITLGKRLSQDFYVTYESSLAGALGTLYIFYDLTKTLTLRGQAGQKSGVDLIYTIKYN